MGYILIGSTFKFKKLYRYINYKNYKHKINSLAFQYANLQQQKN